MDIFNWEKHKRERAADKREDAAIALANSIRRDALLVEAAAMLREVQWLQYYSVGDEYACIFCHGKMTMGHRPECRLGALLKKL